VVIKYPDVSKDFPKLIRTLGLMETKFDYWDDLVMNIYKNSQEGRIHLESYFTTLRWVHLNKRYPTCPDLENDWSYAKDSILKNVRNTKYKVDKEKLQNSPLNEYAIDPAISNLLPAE
jgi:hypothetical protein